MWRSVGLKASLLIVMVSLCATLLIVNAELPIVNAEGAFVDWTSPTPSSLYSVFMVSGSDGWAVGYGGTPFRWDGTSWSIVPRPTTYCLQSVFMVSASDGWAVGEYGTIVRWNGTSWSIVPRPTTYRLYSVFMVSASDGWAVGEYGTIVRWNGTSWGTVASPTTYRLQSVFMVSASDGWAVDEGGTIVRWDGTSWSIVASPTPSSLQSVFMVSASDGWAVGYGGTIVRWNGTSWGTVASPTTYPLQSVFMVSASDGWAVGEYGTIIRYVLAPEAAFTYSPPEPKVGETVSFDASGSSDPDGTIVSYAWDFGDGNITTVDDPIITHAYTTAGTYTVTLTVTDNDGLTDTVTADITVFSPELESPVASFTCSSAELQVYETVTFDASNSSDPDGTIVSYNWDFGDGTTGTGVITTHTYAKKGTYTVYLTVKDAAGNSDTDTVVIAVQEAAAAFPLWALVPIIGGIASVTAVSVYLKKRKPKEKVPKPARLRITAEPTEILADGKARSTITIRLVDEEDKPIAASAATEVKLAATGGKIERPLVEVPKGKDMGKTFLVSSTESGTINVSADAKGLKSMAITLEFVEKPRFCMGCGNRLAAKGVACKKCGASPADFGGPETRTCHCGAVIPATAGFCSECGAKQAPAEA